MCSSISTMFVHMMVELAVLMPRTGLTKELSVASFSAVRARVSFCRSMAAVEGVGAGAVFPVGASVSAHGGSVAAELLVDVSEGLVKAGVLHVRIGVDAVPAVRECCLLREQIGVLDLGAEDDGGAGAVVGMLDTSAERAAACPRAAGRRAEGRRGSASACSGASTRGEPSCRQGLPRRGRLFVEVALKKNRSAVVVAAGGEIVDAGGGEDGGVGPGVGGNVGDVGVVEGRAVFACEVGAGIEGADQRLRRGQAGEQVGVLGGMKSC